jgi:hypothetical protein
MLTTLRPLLVLFVASISGVAQATGEGEVDGFIANHGQLDPSVRYYATSSRAAVYFTDQGPVLELREFVPSEEHSTGLTGQLPKRSREQRQPGSTRRFAVAIRFAEVSGPTRIESVGDANPSRRFLLGAGTAVGATEVAAFERVAYRGVWPGIDVVYAAGENGLEYEIVVEPGADPSRVRFVYEGASSVEVADGATRISTPLGTIEDQPGSERSPGGRLEWTPATFDARSIAAGPDLTPRLPNQASVLSSAQDSWGTFLGGERDETVYALVVDAQGRIIVTGSTRSEGFPTTLGAVDTTYGGSFDVFVSQFSDDGSELLWSTFIGGAGDDRGWAIALDDAGRPVVAGVTSGNGFPTTPGAFDETPNGGYDAFVFKLAADGSSLVWSTYYGGSDSEWDVSGLDIDSLGRPVLAGSTPSDDLPTSPLAYASGLAGATDAFVARLAADGSTLDYGTYLGGTGFDVAEDVVVTASGSAAVVGSTDSTDFPVTAGVLQSSPDPGSKDGFVSGLSPDGSALLFSTYLGGTGDDDPYTVTLDDLERIVIAGQTGSADFPTTAGAYSPLPAGSDDAFVSEIEGDASAIVWSTYFGGSSTDRALDLVRDSSPGFAFAGWTCSEDLPLTPNAVSGEYMGPGEAFVAGLSEDGSAISYSSYLGGWLDESAFGLAVDLFDRLIVGGETWSTDFPVTLTSYDPTHNSPDTWADGFVMAIGTGGTCTSMTLGAEGPELMLSKAPDGVCPALPPLTSRVDLIEGWLDMLSPTTIGPVIDLLCYSFDAVKKTASIPEPGSGLFQLSRLVDGGSYEDGGGMGLSSSRLPTSGDCP